MKTTNTNCGVCWIQDNRQTPGTWAQIDGKDVDFYCDAHLRALDIDVAECETIEAWRRMNGMAIGEASANQATHSAAGPRAPEFKPSREPQYCIGCGNRLRWGWPSNMCRGCMEEAARAERLAAPTPERPKRGRPPLKTPPTHKPANGNGHAQQVAGLNVAVMSLDDYREKFPIKNSYRGLDPIVSFVAAMDRKTVARFEAPQGAKVKSFRDRIAKMLQVRHKLPVIVEQNNANNCIAVIWKEKA